MNQVNEAQKPSSVTSESPRPAQPQQYGLEQLAHCKNCDDGDPVKFLDIDGVNCKVSGDTLGELCHASGEYYWPCPRWCALVDRMHGAEYIEGCAIADANSPLAAAAPALYEAARTVLAGLNARIDAARDEGGHSVPVFDGIAELHAAIALAEGKQQ
jgi:hypothetical protein